MVNVKSLKVLDLFARIYKRQTEFDIEFKFTFFPSKKYKRN